MIGALLLLGSLLAGWAWMEFEEFLAPLKVAEGSIIYAVPKGATLASVASDLRGNGMINAHVTCAGTDNTGPGERSAGRTA